MQGWHTRTYQQDKCRHMEAAAFCDSDTYDPVRDRAPDKRLWLRSCPNFRENENRVAIQSFRRDPSLLELQSQTAPTPGNR